MHQLTVPKLLAPCCDCKRVTHQSEAHVLPASTPSHNIRIYHIIDISEQILQRVLEQLPDCGVLIYQAAAVLCEALSASLEMHMTQSYGVGRRTHHMSILKYHKQLSFHGRQFGNPMPFQMPRERPTHYLMSLLGIHLSSILHSYTA